MVLEGKYRRHTSRISALKIHESFVPNLIQNLKKKWVFFVRGFFCFFNFLENFSSSRNRIKFFDFYENLSDLFNMSKKKQEKGRI